MGCAGNSTRAELFLTPGLRCVFEYRQAEWVNVRHLDIVEDLNWVGVRFKWISPEHGLALATVCCDVRVVNELDILNQGLRAPRSISVDVVDGKLARLRDMEVFSACTAREKH